MDLAGWWLYVARVTAAELWRSLPGPWPVKALLGGLDETVSETRQDNGLNRGLTGQNSSSSAEGPSSATPTCHARTAGSSSSLTVKNARSRVPSGAVARAIRKGESGIAGHW